MSTPGAVLVVNSGSSSLKFGLYDDAAKARLRGSITHLGSQKGQEEAFQEVVSRLEDAGGPKPAAIGHRVVHGGPRLTEHQALTPDVMRALEDATHFAPLHLPPALRLIRAAQARFPGVPQFACFDTAFHTSLPAVASTLPLPRSVREQGVRRYGFHGLSYESIVARLGPAVPARAVVAHLGSGASLVALERGRSVDTSMGFTPTGGIPMGTRTGDLDPGVPLYLLRSGGLDVDALEAMLNHDAGLRALSDGTSDMQALTRDMAQSAGAALAVEVFTRSIAKTVGAYAAVLGGLDLLVFTGGIGEHSAEVRARVCATLGHLGVTLDARRNTAGEEVISAEEAACPVRVMPSDEEGQLARHTLRLLSG